MADTHNSLRENAWKLIEIEYLGNFEYNSEQIFLLKMTDVYSNWVSYVPMKEESYHTVASAVVSEFASFTFPLAIRFVKKFFMSNGKHIVELLQKCIEDLVREVNEASKLMKLIDSRSYPSKLFPLHFAIKHFDEGSSIVLDSFDHFQEIARMNNNNKSSTSENILYVFIGHHSLLSEIIQNWFSKALDQFLKLNPTTWVIKLPCFLLSLRRSCPPGSQVSPANYIFHEDWQIFNPLPPIASKTLTSKNASIQHELQLKKESTNTTPSTFKTDSLKVKEISQKNAFSTKNGFFSRNKSRSFHRSSSDEEDVDNPSSLAELSDEDDTKSLDSNSTTGSLFQSKFKLKESKIKVTKLSDDVVESAEQGRLVLSSHSNNICQCNRKSVLKKRSADESFDCYEEAFISTKKSRSETSTKTSEKSFVPRNRDGASGIPAKCSHCDKIYLTSDPEFTIHLKCHANGLQGYKCYVCQKNISEWSDMLIHLEDHIEIKHRIKEMRKHTQENTICPLCQEDFNTRNLLERHLKFGHLNCASDVCNHCGKKTAENSDNSKNQKHGMGNPSTSFVRQYNKKPAEQDIRYPVRCHNCEGTYLSSAKELHLHLECHKGGKELKCPYCGYHNKVWEKILLHMKSHEISQKRIMDIEKNAEKMRTCPHCSEDFNSVYEMMCHVKSIHFKGSFYQCKICWKAYNEKKSLQKHKVIHDMLTNQNKTVEQSRTISQDVKEEKSGKRVMSKENIESAQSSSMQPFNSGEDIHKYEKSAYNCPKCDRLLTMEVEFHMHLNCHQKDGHGFKCLYCNETNDHWTKLLLHLKTHKFVRKTVLEIIAAKRKCQKKFKDDRSTSNRKKKGTISQGQIQSEDFKSSANRRKHNEDKPTLPVKHVRTQSTGTCTKRILHEHQSKVINEDLSISGNTSTLKMQSLTQVTNSGEYPDDNQKVNSNLQALRSTKAQLLAQLNKLKSCSEKINNPDDSTVNSKLQKLRSTKAQLLAQLNKLKSCSNSINNSDDSTLNKNAKDQNCEAPISEDSVKESIEDLEKFSVKSDPEDCEILYIKEKCTNSQINAGIPGEKFESIVEIAEDNMKYFICEHGKSSSINEYKKDCEDLSNDDGNMLIHQSKSFVEANFESIIEIEESRDENYDLSVERNKMHCDRPQKEGQVFLMESKNDKFASSRRSICEPPQLEPVESVISQSYLPFQEYLSSPPKLKVMSPSYKKKITSSSNS